MLEWLSFWAWAMIRQARNKAGIEPSLKQMDTLAAEFPAQINYLYFSYHGSEDEDVGAGQVSSSNDRNKAALVLGGGAYRIGSSVGSTALVFNAFIRCVLRVPTPSC
jgi:hypothetical protein